MSLSLFRKSYVRKPKPFIKWLQEAEVEDSAESEDDNEEVSLYLKMICITLLNR